MGRFYSVVAAVCLVVLVSQSSCSKPPAPNEPPAAQASEVATQPAEAAVAVPVVTPVSNESEQVQLGMPELTAGIPGSGPLGEDEINAWLDDPKNHVVITPVLPLGLAAGAAQIAGLDQNPLTRAKIELGRELFFDPRLSQDGSISCASCHDPDFGYAKNTQFGVGVRGQLGGRNSPTAYNRILSALQFWDGRAASLEEQSKGPIANPVEMSNTHEVCVAYLGKIPGYKLQFERIFPDGVNIDNVAKAIASFERVLVTAPSPWDYYEQLRNFNQAYADDLEDLDTLKADDPDLYAEYMEVKGASDAHPIAQAPSAAANYSSATRPAARPATSAPITRTSCITTSASAWTRRNRTSAVTKSPRMKKIAAHSRRRRSAMWR